MNAVKYEPRNAASFIKTKLIIKWLKTILVLIKYFIFNTMHLHWRYSMNVNRLEIFISNIFKKIIINQRIYNNFTQTGMKIYVF